MNDEMSIEEIEQQIKAYSEWYKRDEPYRTHWKKSYDNWTERYIEEGRDRNEETEILLRLHPVVVAEQGMEKHQAEVEGNG